MRSFSKLKHVVNIVVNRITIIVPSALDLASRNGTSLNIATDSRKFSLHLLKADQLSQNLTTLTQHFETLRITASGVGIPRTSCLRFAKMVA
jgi:hypothetical protein